MSQVPEALKFSTVPIAMSKVPPAFGVPTGVPALLRVTDTPVIPVAPQVLDVPGDASPLFVGKGGLVFPGEVNETSGFLCKIGGFCLFGDPAGKGGVTSAAVAFRGREAGFSL